MLTSPGEVFVLFTEWQVVHVRIYLVSGLGLPQLISSFFYFFFHLN
jgi:hypothetical protein